MQFISRDKNTVNYLNLYKLYLFIQYKIVTIS